MLFEVFGNRKAVEDEVSGPVDVQGTPLDDRALTADGQYLKTRSTVSPVKSTLDESLVGSCFAEGCAEA